MAERVGILAYGSVITDPGKEIQHAIVETRNVILTPFNIEFALERNAPGFKEEKTRASLKEIRQQLHDPEEN